MGLYGKLLTSSFFFLLLPCLIIVFGLGITDDADCNASELLARLQNSLILVKYPVEKRGRMDESDMLKQEFNIVVGRYRVRVVDPAIVLQTISRAAHRAIRARRTLCLRFISNC